MGVGGYIVLNLRSWKDDSALAVLAEDPATSAYIALTAI